MKVLVYENSYSESIGGFNAPKLERVVLPIPPEFQEEELRLYYINPQGVVRLTPLGVYAQKNGVRDLFCKVYDLTEEEIELVKKGGVVGHEILLNRSSE